MTLHIDMILILISIDDGDTEYLMFILILMSILRFLHRILYIGTDNDIILVLVLTLKSILVLHRDMCAGINIDSENR